MILQALLQKKLITWMTLSWKADDVGILNGEFPTVDGVPRNPVKSAGEVGSLSHYLHGFIQTSQVVVWDFWTINSSKLPI